MRANVNIEFTGKDIRKYAVDIGRRWVVGALHDVIAHVNELKLTPESVKGIKEILVQLVREAAQATAPHEPAVTIDNPEPPPQKQQPKHTCSRTEPDSLLDDGWICCCGVYNGTHRIECRACKHGRCDVVVTPPPGTPSGSA